MKKYNINLLSLSLVFLFLTFLVGCGEEQDRSSDLKKGKEMEIKLFATSPTEIVTNENTIKTLPSGYIPFKIQCDKISEEEKSDILIVRKQIKLKDGLYSTETKFHASDLLEDIPSGNAMTKEALMAIPGMENSEFIPIIEGIKLIEDSRDNIYFSLQITEKTHPVLCMLRIKYFGADLDVVLRYDNRWKKSRGIYAILTPAPPVFTPDGENDAIPLGTPIYFKINEKTFFWNNSALIAEEDGQKYWAKNGIPMLERWEKE